MRKKTIAPTILFFELPFPFRVGGIEAATKGLAEHLPGISIQPVRFAKLHHLFSRPRGTAHFHGTWYLPHAFVHLLARVMGWRVVISSHGALAPWPLSHHAPRKYIYWLLIEYFRFLNADFVIASSRLERRHIRSLSPRATIAVARIGIDPPNVLNNSSVFTSHVAKIQKRRVVKFLFFGRIHPVKRVRELIEAFVRIKTSHVELGDEVQLELRIAGPGEPSYLRDCRQAATTCNADKTVDFLGPIWGNEKWDVLKDADLLCLPSRSENFGIVAAEALSLGVPVLTTHSTPWPEEGPVGHVLTTTGTLDSIAIELENFLRNLDKYRAARPLLIDWARRNLLWPEVLPVYKKIYNARTT